MSYLLLLQMEVDNATLAKSKAGKTRGARSDWSHSQVFSDDDEEEATTKGGRSQASLWGDGSGKPVKGPKSRAASRKVLPECVAILPDHVWRRPVQSCMKEAIYCMEAGFLFDRPVTALHLHHLQTSTGLSLEVKIWADP